MNINFKKTVEVQGSKIRIKHWEVMEFSVNFLGNHARVTLRGFKTKEDKLAGATPVPGSYTVVLIQGEDFDDIMTKGFENHAKTVIKRHLKNKDTILNGAEDD